MLKQAVVLMGLLSGGAVANATTTFQIEQVDYVQNFSSYEIGSTLQENGWTLNATYFSIKAPSSGGSSQSKVATITDTSRRVTLSPELDFDPGYKLGDTIFLSAEIRVINQGGSGVAIGLRNSNNQNIAFLRLTDMNPNGTLAMRGTGTDWSISSDRASHSTWYQVLLAIELDSNDITQSTGTLFYRDLNEPGSVLTAAEGLQNINLGFTETTNPLDIAFIRIENARQNVEFGNIQIGKGSIIPEQGHIPGVMGILALLMVVYFRRKNARSA